MVTPFDALEADFFGELAEDTHGLWEVFEFVRCHHPELADERVFEHGREHVIRWIESDWIRISDTPLYPSTVTSLPQAMEFLRQHGPAATRYLENSPSIDLTKEALRVRLNRKSSIDSPTNSNRMAKNVFP
jgi:hypothetical protein